METWENLTITGLVSVTAVTIYKGIKQSWPYFLNLIKQKEEINLLKSDIKTIKEELNEMKAISKKWEKGFHEISRGDLETISKIQEKCFDDLFFEIKRQYFYDKYPDFLNITRKAMNNFLESSNIKMIASGFSMYLPAICDAQDLSIGHFFIYRRPEFEYFSVDNLKMQEFSDFLEKVKKEMFERFLENLDKMVKVKEYYKNIACL